MVHTSQISKQIHVPSDAHVLRYSFNMNFLSSGILCSGSLLGNEELDLGGDSPIFEIIYPNKTFEIEIVLII